MGIGLYDYQIDAVKRMRNGCVLSGGVGSGKSRTALAYYYLLNGGAFSSLKNESSYIQMDNPPLDLYIITTPHKRDSKEWLGDMSPFLMSPNKECTPYTNNIIIDSWNNIKKYSKVYGAFFIFDEQRVVGKGAWVKAFLKITNKNKWILLSATPGDTWSDYIPLFIANGFYKNRTEFNNRHIIWSSFTKYPKIDRYIDTGILLKYKNDILIDMDYNRKIIKNDQNVYVGYDLIAYKDVIKNRYNPYKEITMPDGRIINKPIENASEYCFVLRKIVNSDISRQHAVLDIIKTHPKVIIFYNYNYELDILKNLNYGSDFIVAEWNGFSHDKIPESDKWVYLVQYMSGAEGWNCITTNTIIFYSQTYSYKTLVQSKGRIDRLNTPFDQLYYYHLKSRSSIDIGIERTVNNKKKFNESKFYTQK